MATSGTYSFSYNRDQIIRGALRKIGAIQAGDIPSAQITQDASDTLNMMVKYWETTGIHVWTESEGVLFTQPNQNTYILGTGTTDHATQTDPPNFIQTALSVADGQGATSISVNSIANILNGDNIGITLTTNAIQWTTVNGAPSGSTINLANALTAPAANGAIIFDYTTNILRPLRVPFARRFVASSTIGTPMVSMSRQEYRDLPNPNSIGTPTQWFYDPQGGANVAGRLYIWPTPTDATNYIRFTWYRPIQDFDTAGDTPDLPQEWINCLVWNLAFELGPEYGCPLDVYQVIKERAAETLSAMMGWDKEIESVKFGVDFGGMGYGR